MDTQQVVKQEALKAFKKFRPCIVTRNIGYVNSIQENLLTNVTEEDFVDELADGDGNELESKFRAVHSSAALAVNNFAPFKRHINDLKLPMGSNFNHLKFEEKCPVFGRGRPPNMDVLIESDTSIVGIESKFTEYLKTTKPVFSDSYNVLRHMDYYQEMQRINGNPFEYSYLNAAQLIKCSYGLAKNYSGKKVFLIYLYWEPSNIDSLPSKHQQIFDSHKREIVKFAGNLQNANPEFVAMSYNELWQYWRKNTRTEWLDNHLNELEERYGFPIN